MAEFLVAVTLIGLACLIPYWYWIRHRAHEEESKTKLEMAVATNMDEPASLHPIFDPNRCISIGACVDACPEGKILGIVNGRAELVSPSKCIGHGACQTACPVDAITLVFGTERRGVEIPDVKETFETNSAGVYIAGELGGMGLICNAVTQGREAVEYIGRSLRKGTSDILDLIIVGAGPAGLSATLQAKKDGLKTVTLEQEDDFGGTILTFPRQKLVMTQEMIIPLYGSFKQREVLKEELVELWKTIVQRSGIEMSCGHNVKAVTRDNGSFVVTTNKGEFRAQKVLLAIGRRGTPRKLEVPGENSSKVAYRLLEPEQYKGKKLLVVGGGDSAVEAAMSLSREEGTTVTLSYRKDVFGRIKQMNRERIEQAITDGKVILCLNSQVREIKVDQVLLTQNDEELALPNDYVFIFAGGVLPNDFLKKIGINMEMKHGTR